MFYVKWKAISLQDTFKLFSFLLNWIENVESVRIKGSVMMKLKVEHARILLKGNRKLIGAQMGVMVKAVPLREYI